MPVAVVDCAIHELVTWNSTGARKTPGFKAYYFHCNWQVPLGPVVAWIIADYCFNFEYYSQRLS